MSKPTFRSSKIPANPAADRRMLEESARLPLMIAGVAGVPGYNGFFHFRKKYGGQILGTRPTRNWPLTRAGILGCDLEDGDQAKRFIESNGVRAIWNCGGSCALKSCELDPEMAYRVNVQSVEKLLEAIRGTDVRLVHFSIDLVFSGTGGGDHVETDTPDPVTIYGKTMVEAEELILSERPDACILRISLPMGLSFNGHAGAIDWIQHRFAKHKPATLYVDEVRTPTYVACLNELVEEIIAGDLRGLYHAGGSRKLSLYQIAQIVNRVGGYDPDLLIGCPRVEAGPMPPRAGNVTLDSGKLKQALGRQPFADWPLREEHLPDSPNWHYSRSNCFDGGIELLAASLYNRP